MKITEIEKIIREIIPKDIEIVKVEPLGLTIAIYVTDIKKIYEYEDLIKKIASTIKKKISIRTEPKKLMDPERTKKIIESIVPKEAEITNISFNTPFSEVIIEAGKPGLVIGKGGEELRKIITQTGWVPIVLRTPSMPSDTVKGIRKSDIVYGEDRKKFLIKVGKAINKDVQPTTWVRTVMLGGFKEVGRSAMLVETEQSKILIECGVNVATTNPREAYPFLDKLGFPPSQLDAVIITHAHMDHVGFLPFLFAYGYDGPVYMTPPTRDLMALLQKDYINILDKYYGVDAPYTKKDIQHELRNTIVVPYNEVVDITPEVKLTFYNAGHILGSSIVHLHIGEGRHNIIYSGDFKFGFTQLFNPAHTQFPRAETVFIESTYGKRGDVMPNRREAEERLIRIIKETIDKKGSVLIPVFAVGRSQEVLLVLEQYARNNPDWNVPIYIDGMVLEASAIHTVYPEYLKTSLERRILSNNSPFEFEWIKVANKADRISIVEGEPAIILAPSGMLSGGPSVEYLKMMAENEKNTLIFVGYQSSLSLGAKIQQGMKEVPVKGDDGKLKNLRINMRVETAEGFSGHSDRRQLMAWLRNINPKPRKVIMMHGEPSKVDEFARDAAKALHVETRAPYNLEAIRLR